MKHSRDIIVTHQFNILTIIYLTNLLLIVLLYFLGYYEMVKFIIIFLCFSIILLLLFEFRGIILSMFKSKYDREP